MSTTPLQLVAGGRIPVGVSGIAELQLLEYLGGGGFGSVWKTLDTARGTPYTLKVIQNVDEKGVDVARVLLEAEVSIASEYVVPVVGLREWSPYTFLIVFEYFSARPLDILLREGALGGVQKRAIFDQILYGVSDAHHNNIIHRDLKPANVLVGDGLRVKLIDFGISKFKDRNITQAGHTFGTPYYMAPELLIHGSSVADAVSDIYALGQLLYELVTGRCLWLHKGWRRMEDFINFLRSVPPPAEVMDFDGFACDFYPNVEDILRRMVKIDPAERFSSVEEIIEELGIATKPAPPVSVYDFPVLIIESGTNRNARTFLHIADGEAAVMGRADFAGDDQSISRCHVEIRRQGRRYWLRDLASKNGTMVGGSRLAPDAPRELSHADRIKIGDIFLRFAFMQQP